MFDVLAGGKAPSGMEDQVEETKSKLMELAAETDDSLIEKFLGGSELTADELVNGLRIALVSGSFVPVFACMPLKDIGISELADGIGRLFPSPGDVQPVDAEGGKIATGTNDPFIGHVWRTVNDPFIGQLVFLRVLGGTLKSESEVFNSVKGEKERIGSILLVNGKTQTQLTEASAGDIIALPKLKVTTMGDTLCAMGKNTVCKPIEFPGPHHGPVDLEELSLAQVGFEFLVDLACLIQDLERGDGEGLDLSQGHIRLPFCFVLKWSMVSDGSAGLAESHVLEFFDLILDVLNGQTGQDILHGLLRVGEDTGEDGLDVSPADAVITGRLGVHRKEVDIAHQAIDLEQGDLRRIPGQRGSSPRAGVGLHESGLAEHPEDAADHDRIGVHTAGDVIGCGRLAAHDRQERQGMDGYGESAVLCHDATS